MLRNTVKAHNASHQRLRKAQLSEVRLHAFVMQFSTFLGFIFDFADP